MSLTPDAGDWDEAENTAGARFRYCSDGDRERIVERIAFALVEQRVRAQRFAPKPVKDEALRTRIEGVAAFLDECAEIHKGREFGMAYYPIAQRLRRALAEESS